MSWQIALPLGLSGGATGLLGFMSYRPSPPLASRELLLPAELSAEQVTALMRHLAAVREGPACFSVQATLGRVRFLMAAPETVMASLAAASGGLMPEAALERPTADPPMAEDDKAVVGARVSWGGRWPVLRSEDPQLTTAALLGVLSSVAPRDQLELKLRLWPAGRVNRPVAPSERSTATVNPWFMRLLWPAQPPREELRVIRSKYSGLLVLGEVLVVARAATAAGAAGYVQRVIAALRSAAGIRGVLRYRTFYGQARARRVMQRRRRPLLWEASTLFSPEELAAVAGLPIDAPMVPGVSYGAGPRLIASLDLPTSGRVFATSNFPATAEQPLAQPVVGGLQHAVLVGPTGSGKSTLLASLAAQDMQVGRGCLVIDMKGDLVEELLGLVPERRQRDVIVLDPARGGAQPGLQLFPAGGDPELTSDLVLGTLAEMFADSWGIRSSQYLGLGLKTLAGSPEATLVNLPLLFTEQAFRTKMLSHVRDPWLQAAWRRFQALSPAERATHVSSPLTKLEELVGRGRVRLVLGQNRSKLDFQEVLAHGRIVLVSLPPGLLGLPAMRLLAALTLWQFFQAVEGRAALAAARRSPFFAYVDEVAVLGALPLPLESILERARGHGVGLTLSPQALSQLSPELRASVLANVGSLLTFGQRSEEEAKVLARVLPGVTATQLQHLGRFEVAMRLSLGPGLVTQTMTGLTVPPPPPVADPSKVRAAAGARWGQTLTEIDAALQRRHGLMHDQQTDGPDGFTGRLGAIRRRP